LDDPLSAVDAHVSKYVLNTNIYFDNCGVNFVLAVYSCRYLFEETICGHLREKTRILVTHQLQYIPQAQQVVVLKDGVIVEQGCFSELMSLKGELHRLMADYAGSTDAPFTSHSLCVLASLNFSTFNSHTHS
jgi:hypothetical protein